MVSQQVLAAQLDMQLDSAAEMERRGAQPSFWQSRSPRGANNGPPMGAERVWSQDYRWHTADCHV